MHTQNKKANTETKKQQTKKLNQKNNKQLIITVVLNACGPKLYSYFGAKSQHKCEIK